METHCWFDGKAEFAQTKSSSVGMLQPLTMVTWTARWHCWQKVQVSLHRGHNRSSAYLCTHSQVLEGHYHCRCFPLFYLRKATICLTLWRFFPCLQSTIFWCALRGIFKSCSSKSNPAIWASATKKHRFEKGKHYCEISSWTLAQVTVH